MISSLFVLITFMIVSREIYGNVYTVQIKVVKGINLEKKDTLYSDPFAMLIVGGKYIGETPTKFKTLNPVWDTVFEVKGVQPLMDASLVLIDRDHNNADDFMGEVKFNIDTNSRKTETLERGVYNNKGEYHGKVVIETTTAWSADPAADAKLKAPVATGPVRYSKYSSHLAGWLANSKSYYKQSTLLAALIENKFDEWNAYEVQLHGIDETMTEKFGYNKKYADIQRFFDDTTSWPKAVRLEHSALYTHDKHTVYGVMSNAMDFFNAISYGCSHEEPVMFTYSIIDNTIFGYNQQLWRFSETGPSKNVDFLSKHIVHANGAREVVYAGEFHVRTGKDNSSPTLVIDNNSGSYTPSEHSLLQLQTLFEKNFPGMRVEAVDRTDKRNADERWSIMAPAFEVHFLPEKSGKGVWKVSDIKATYKLAVNTDSKDNRKEFDIIKDRKIIKNYSKYIQMNELKTNAKIRLLPDHLLPEIMQQNYPTNVTTIYQIIATFVNHDKETRAREHRWSLPLKCLGSIMSIVDRKYQPKWSCGDNCFRLEIHQPFDYSYKKKPVYNVDYDVLNKAVFVEKKCKKERKNEEWHKMML